MDTIRIAHISDLHFGAQGQEDVWNVLRDYLNDTLKPNFILITGDIAHTPDMDLFNTAKSQLDLLRVQRPNPKDAYLVCPGNHDRHPLGNAPGPFAPIVKAYRGWRGVSSWFDNAFNGVTPTIKNPEKLELEVDKNQWTLRIIGCDTSARAEYTALGFAPAEDLDGLPGAAKGDPEAHLVILMHHHHLLSIWELEKSRQQLNDMLKPTIMLNAGTMLEALAQGHVNIVLHGHEHYRAYARYGTVRGQQSETVVVGAGSATGNDSRLGCDIKRASFNLLELRRDRSVYVQEIGHDGLKWDTKGNPVKLIDGRTIRRARSYRHAVPDSSPTSKIVKCIEFHSDRTVDVTQTWTDWTLEDGQEGRWTLRTINSSGIPSGAWIRFDWAQGEPDEFENVPFLPDSSDHTYRVDVQTSRKARSLARRIGIEFQWLGGAVLTTDDLEYLDSTKRGEFRSAGREYAAIGTPNGLESLSLLVRLPPVFAPQAEKIEVSYVKPGASDGKFELSAELAAALQHHAPGVFSLEVPYPRRGYRYALSWPLVEGPRPSEAALHFREIAQNEKRAEQLLQAFASVLRRCPITTSVSLGLYVHVPNGHSSLRRVGNVHVGIDQRPSEGPPSLSVRNDNTLYRNAWWGQIQRAVEHGGDAVFMPGERAVAVVPIRQFGRENDVTWALVRVGIRADYETSNEDLARALAERQVAEVLADGVVMVLKEAAETG